YRSRIHVPPARGRGTDFRRCTAVGFGATHARWIDLLPRRATGFHVYLQARPAAGCSVRELAAGEAPATASPYRRCAREPVRRVGGDTTAAHGASSGASGTHRTRHQLLTKSRATCERELSQCGGHWASQARAGTSAITSRGSGTPAKGARTARDARSGEDRRPRLCRARNQGGAAAGEGVDR